VQAFQGARSALAYEVRLRLLEAESEQGARSDRVEDWRRLATEARAVLGPEHQVVGEAALGAALALVFSGQAHRAAEDARMAHRALSAALGPDHPTTLRALTALAHSLRVGGDAQGALQALANAHALQQARLGPDHPDTLFQLNEWAYTLTVLGHYEESAARFAEQVERRRKDPQTPGFWLGQALANYAHARLRQGRVDEAVAAYQEAVTAIARSAEAPASVRVSGWRGLADALRAAGQAEQAAQALEQAQQFAEQLPEGDPRRLGVDGTRALLLIDRGERAAGRALLDATIEQLAGKVAPDTPLLRTLIAEREALDAGR
jgi:tetratricopeptide (TPR) repeat protein